jgi:hypothetical protein
VRVTGRAGRSDNGVVPDGGDGLDELRLGGVICSAARGRGASSFGGATRAPRAAGVDEEAVTRDRDDAGESARRAAEADVGRADDGRAGAGRGPSAPVARTGSDARLACVLTGSTDTIDGGRAIPASSRVAPYPARRPSSPRRRPCATPALNPAACPSSRARMAALSRIARCASTRASSASCRAASRSEATPRELGLHAPGGGARALRDVRMNAHSLACARRVRAHGDGVLRTADESVCTAFGLPGAR